MTKGWSGMLIPSCACLQNGGNLSTGVALWREARCAFEMQPDLSHSSLSEVCGALFVLNFVILDQQYAIMLPTQACDFHFTLIPHIIVWALKLTCFGGTGMHTEAGRWGPVRLTGISWDAICNPQELIEHSWAPTRAGKERRKNLAWEKKKSYGTIFSTRAELQVQCKTVKKQVWLANLSFISMRYWQEKN